MLSWPKHLNGMDGFHIPLEISMFPEMCSVWDWAGYRVIDNTGWTISLVNTCLTDKVTWSHKSQVFKLWLTHWWVLSLALLFFLSLLLLSLSLSAFLFSPACSVNPKLLVKVDENWPLALVRIRILEEPLRSQLRSLLTMFLSYLIKFLLSAFGWYGCTCMCWKGGVINYDPMTGNDTANAWGEVVIYTKDGRPDNWIRPHQLFLYHTKW